MRVFQSPDFPHLINPVVTVGFFDGVHKGHQNIISQLIKTATNKNVDSLIITMWPHPSVLINNKAPGRFLLTTLDEKLILFEKSRAQNVLVLNFDKELANLPASDFIEQILVKQLNASAILMGYNNSFGKGGETINEIKKCSLKHKLDIVMSDEIMHSEQKISSSSVRNLFAQGKIPEANNILGYIYSIEGVVVSGYKIGRTLGFKTANIKPCFDEKILPANGVYAIEVVIEKSNYHGMMNIGMRPSFDGKQLSLEAHIFNFDDNIYGEIVTIRFFKKLRDEARFDSIAELKMQLESDKSDAMQYFGINE